MKIKIIPSKVLSTGVYLKISGKKLSSVPGKTARLAVA